MRPQNQASAGRFRDDVQATGLFMGLAATAGGDFVVGVHVEAGTHGTHGTHGRTGAPDHGRHAWERPRLRCRRS